MARGFEGFVASGILRLQRRRFWISVQSPELNPTARTWVSPGLVCFSFRALTVNAAWSEVPMSLSCTDDENRCFLLLQGGSRA